MVEVVVDQMTFDFALAGLTHDYHFLSFRVVVATFVVTSHDDKRVAVSPPVAHANGESLTTLSPQSTSKLPPHSQHWNVSSLIGSSTGTSKKGTGTFSLLGKQVTAKQGTGIVP